MFCSQRGCRKDGIWVCLCDMQWTEEEEEEFKKKTVDAYEREASPYFSTARLWDDGVIDPSDTRKVLGLCLSAASNRPLEDTRFGVFRM